MDIDRLEEIAKAAPPGSWFCEQVLALIARVRELEDRLQDSGELRDWDDELEARRHD